MKYGYAEFDCYDTPLSAISKRARWTPDRVFIEEIGRDKLTFGQFDLLIRRWSDALRRHGVGEGDRVATMVQPSSEAAISWLSSALLRAVEVPINTDYRGEMLYYLLRDSGAKLLITMSQYVDRLDELTTRAPELQTVVVLDGECWHSQLGVKTISGQEFLAGAEPLEGLEVPQPWE
jgi:crotonobetaine/carnitine-CoA ligase